MMIAFAEGGFSVQFVALTTFTSIALVSVVLGTRRGTILAAGGA